MKKAKVLIPALAVLALSATAAVTGTAAWFSAARTAKITASDLAIVNTAGALLTTIDGHAGAASAGDNKTVTYGNLTDGSVDLEDGTVHKRNADETTFSTVDITTSVAGEFTAYRAASFDVHFKLDKTTDKSATYGLFFDIQASKTATGTLNSGNTTTTENEVQKALRVGFKTTSSWSVWAPFRTDFADTFGYIKTDNTQTTYKAESKTANLLLGHTPETAKSTDTTIANGYLGAMNSTNISTALDVKVFTWLEGCDPACDEEKLNNMKWGIDLNFVICSTK